MKKITKAVIPVAGMGTRFLPVTKSVPKEMLPIVDKPTLQYIIEECVESGIEQVLLITSPYKRNIEDHFDQSFELEKRLEKNNKLKELEIVQNISNLVDIYYIRQGEPLGSGHAISLAKAFINDEPFAVLYGDDLMDSEVPVLKQLIDVYEKHDCNVIGVQKVEPHLVSKYGMIEFDQGDKIKTIVEKPNIGEEPSLYAGLGRYIVKPEIFEELSHLSKGKGGEYQFTDAMMNLMQKQDFYACKFKGTYYDIGNQLGYLKANIDFALKREDLKNSLKEYLKRISS